MRFRSTRRQAPAVPLTAAILRGLAPDGGLYVPERLPSFAAGDFSEADFVAGAPRAETAAALLEPFFAGDALAPAREAICRGALDFPLPLVDLEPGVALLELFHGPTAAFKDVGARFLARCLERAEEPRTILVATSGDTGGAIAAAFHRAAGVEVGVLFPRDGVSALQRQQLTCWGDNVRSFAVDGTFDDCQRLVKAAFADETWRARRRLTSANSINIGRLLPQTVYYAAASLEYRARHGAAPRFVVPSGNVGNACAAVWAREMGFPIAGVLLATNRNRTVPDWFATGRWEPRPSVATPANAMDVGDPSNMERLFDLYADAAELRRAVSSVAVEDERLLAGVAAAAGRWDRILCPHTGAAVEAHLRDPAPHDVLVATAHAAKFRDVVEPRIGRRVELPPALADLMRLPARETPLPADLGALQRAMDAPPDGTLRA